MYYTHPCSYCNKIFYTFNNDKFVAAQKLYGGIKQHLIDYNEDHKEYQFDDGATIDTDEVYNAMKAYAEEPVGAYEL